MPKIFISYRRDDSQSVADRLHEKLEGHFSARNVFFDVDSIPVGRNFVEYLDEQVSQCDVLLAVIGRRWLDAKNENGALRLHDENDFVRIEIASALGRGITVIPVLVEGGTVPPIDALPPQIEQLSFMNAAHVRPGRDFRRDIDDLIKALESIERPLQIHVDCDGQQSGPYSLEDMNRYLADGTLRETGFAWHDGMTEWKPLSEVMANISAKQTQSKPKDSGAGEAVGERTYYDQGGVLVTSSRYVAPVEQGNSVTYAIKTITSVTLIEHDRTEELSAKIKSYTQQHDSNMHRYYYYAPFLVGVPVLGVAMIYIDGGTMSTTDWVYPAAHFVLGFFILCLLSKKEDSKSAKEAKLKVDIAKIESDYCNYYSIDITSASNTTETYTSIDKKEAEAIVHALNEAIVNS